MKASGNIELEIVYLDGQRAVDTPLAAVAFDSEADAREMLETVAYDTLTETPDACAVVARTSAYSALWAEAYDEGDGPVVTSGTDV